MKLKIKEGTTSKLVRVFAQDSSATDGSGLTGLAYNSAGLVAYYLPEGDATPVAITLQTMTVGTWVSGGFKEIHATNMPGAYEIGLPNAVIDATSQGSVLVMIFGATNMAPIVLEIELDKLDYRSTSWNGDPIQYLDYSVGNVVGDVTAEVVAKGNETQAMIGDAEGNLQLSIGVVGGQTTAIKAKTDQLAFTAGLVQVVLHDATAAGLAKFATVDTLESTAAAGSVALLSQGGGGGGGGDTAAIITGVLDGLTDPVVLSQPVATSGQITEPIIIGDDYLAANERAFVWTVAEVPGVVVGTAACTFGAAHPKKGSFLVTGTITDNGDGTWELSFDLTRDDTDGLPEGEYEWTVQVTDATGNEITRVRNRENCKVQLIDKQT